MCGIAGYVGMDDRQLLQAMCDSLTHRGPEDDGFYCAPGVGLGMRRLAIIDLFTGKQPITNETRDVWVVLNGEIYNYEELRAQLISRGHVFATSSDTETIVHLYEDHGVDFVHHLRGMFGIALWDTKRRRLVLARDRVGEKPLFYSWDGARLLFGSEIKAILQTGAKRDVDPQAICEYLAAGYVSGERTFYRDVAKLPPGSLLVHENGRVSVTRYWKPTVARVQPRDPAAVVDELAERLSEAVRLCLKSDVEVGAFLSGGIDSSVIVALMKQHAAHVQTFSVGYGGRATGFNELAYAHRVASELGTEHHELILHARSSIDLLPRILWHYDEPHGEPTSVLVYLLCQFTRRRVKVALSGTGGDEIFFGYPRHRGIRLLQYYRAVPALVRKHAVERVVARWPESTTGSRFAKRVRRFVDGADLPGSEAYLSWVSLLSAEVRQSLLSESIRGSAEDPSGEGFLREHLMGPGPESLLQRAARLDVEGYLPEYQLTYMDRMSMAHGLEVRAPLCDYDLVSWALSLPESTRLKGTRSKHIFKQVARRWIPREIAERPKVGFDSPIGQWFKDQLRPFLDRFLSVEHVGRSGLLDPAAVKRLIGDHVAGRRDYSLQLWSLVALEGWYRMYMEDAVLDGRSYRLDDLRGAVGAGGVALRGDAEREPRPAGRLRMAREERE
jgi:asparagine synthase (glutamine-hydrolysing)